MIIQRKFYCFTTIILLLAILGCNNTDRSAGAIDQLKDSAKGIIEVTDRAPQIDSIKPLADTIFAGDKDTTVQIKDQAAYIMGHIVANKKQPGYTVQGKKGQIVTAVIKPMQKGGNVRINQIQQPGGAFDGPFGDSLSYTFKRNGALRFIIGQNLMAGDPYTGDFILRITSSE